MIFWRESYTYIGRERPEREQRELGRQMYENKGTPEWPLWLPIGFVVPENSASVPLSLRDDVEWDLTWELTDRELYFKNRITGKRVTARPKSALTTSMKDKLEPTPGHPSERQKKEALAAALEAGYSKRLFLQIVSYGVNLNTHVLDLDRAEMAHAAGSLLGFGAVPTTPLECAVAHERLDLVHLFLDNGADTNFTVSLPHGPALLSAVRQKSQELIKILVQKTDRVSCTRALALAVEQQDTALVTTLLACGVRCDFEESDRPLPHRSSCGNFEVALSRGLKAEDLTPPLVRAARLGNTHLASLLLAHGADANVAYHGLGGHEDGYKHGVGYAEDSRIRAYFSCGRAIQIAMEIKHAELIRLLVDAGADINLAQPVWRVSAWCVPGHACQPVPRTVYLELMDDFRAAVAGRAGNGG